MNKIINKIFPVVVLTFVLALSSCLNDSDYDNNLIGTKNNGGQDFVEVHLTSAENSNTVSRSYDNMTRDTTISLIPINLTSGLATNDVTVTFEILDTTKSEVLKTYVDEDGYVIPDLTKYKIQNVENKVVIPAGSKTGYIQVKFKPSDFLGSTYAFGIKITNISDSKYTISNLNTGYVIFGIKNMYDGEYEITGTMVDAAVPTISGAYPYNAYLITQDGTSVALYEPTRHDYYHLIMSGTSFSVYGAFSPVFKFDANSNVIEVVNKYGQPAPNGRSAQLDPSGVNKFDPVTRTLKVKYWLNQPGATHRTAFDETYEYVGPR